jgi:ribonuclease T2
MMRLFKLGLLAAFGLINGAQPRLGAAPRCAVPPTIEQPEVEHPNPREVKIAPVTGYLLALSWSPQFCREHQGDRRHASQCNASAPFGFILHGLWPEGEGRDDPAWCAPTNALPLPQIRANFCMMPSAKLQQHEWAKHGTCMTPDPARYFKAAGILFNAIRLPDMDALSRQGTTVGQFVKTLSVINTGLPAAAIDIENGRGDWLKSVNICLGKEFRPRACPGQNRQPNASRPLKIWRAVK